MEQTTNRRAEIERQLTEARHDLETNTKIYTDRIAALESELAGLGAWEPKVGERVKCEGTIEAIGFHGLCCDVLFDGATYKNGVDTAALRPACGEGEGTQPDAEPVGYLCGGLFFSDKGQAKVVQHNNRDLDFKVEPLYRHPAPTPEPPAVEDDSADLYNSITANLKSAECALAIISGYVLDTDAYPYLRDMFRHPSPVSGAVAAGKGVAEELREAAKEWADAAVHCYSLKCRLGREPYCSTVMAHDRFTAALAKIVELPEPTTWARHIVTRWSVEGVPVREILKRQQLDLAAALIEAAAKEGK